MTYVRRSNYRWYNYNTRRKCGLPRSRPHAMGNPLANMYPHEYAKSTSPMFRKQGLYWYNKNRGRKEFGGNQKDWWASDPVGYRLPPNLSKSFSLRDVGCTRAIGAPPPDYNPYMEDHRRYPISLSASPVFLVDFLITYVAKAWTRAQIQQYLATLARLYPTIDKLRYALIEQEYFNAGGKPDDHVVPFVTTTELMNVWANGRSLLSGSGRIPDPHRLPFEDVHSQIHGIMRKEKESGYVPVPENFLKHLVYLTDAIFWQRKVEENRSTLHQKGQLRTMEGEMYYALPYPRGASFPISLAQPEAEQPSRDYADLLDVEIHPIFQLGRFQRENISP